MLSKLEKRAIKNIKEGKPVMYRMQTRGRFAFDGEMHDALILECKMDLHPIPDDTPLFPPSGGWDTMYWTGIGQHLSAGPTPIQQSPVVDSE